MIYREEGRKLSGIWNRTNKFNSDKHCVIYGDQGLPEIEAFLRDHGKKWSSEASQDRRNAPKQSWDLSAGYSGAMAMARDGWHEGVENLDAKLHAIIPAAGHEPRWGYAVTGGSININRYLQGHPKSMRNRRKKQMGSAPVLHIVVNGTASCMVNADQMANYGTALVGLIDRLENSGKRVHLDVVFVTYMPSNNGRLACGWNVKRASEAVDLSAVAFSIGHPAAFRRIGFALMERSPSAYMDYGYGYCADLRIEDVPDGNDATMLIDGINHEPTRCNTPQDALRFAIEQINKAAVIAGHSTPDQPLIPEDEELFAYA